MPKKSIVIRQRHPALKLWFRVESLEARCLLSGAGLFSSDQDIGSPAQAGSLAYANGAYTMTGGGARNSDTVGLAP